MKYSFTVELIRLDAHSWRAGVDNLNTKDGLIHCATAYGDSPGNAISALAKQVDCCFPLDN